MTVSDGDFIRVSYTETVDGEVMYTTDKDLAIEKGFYEEGSEYGPKLIVLGSGDVVEGFKEDLIGKEVGYSGSIEIPPEKAHGERDPNSVELISLNKFKEERPQLGMRVSVEGKMGTVTRVIGRKVRVDYNHPLAGKTVKYDYTIEDKVEDRLEKLTCLVNLFARVDLKSEITEDDIAEIESPWELNYYKEWSMIRRGVAEMAMRLLDLKEVHYVEKHVLTPTVTSQLVSPPSKAEEGEENVEAAPEAKTPAEVPETPEPVTGEATEVASEKEE